MTLLALLAAATLLSPSAEARVCNWCVFGEPKLTADLVTLSRMDPRSQLSTIRGRGVCVKIVDTGRKAPAGSFAWGTVEKPELTLRQMIKVAGEPGHMFCQGEVPESQSCPLISLSNDAPKSTLLFEYVRYLQSTRDKDWCSLARRMQGRAVTGTQWKLTRDHEWDAYLFFWNQLNHLDLALEDKIQLISGVINEAEQRKTYDKDGAQFLKVDNPSEQLELYRRQFEDRRQRLQQ